MGQCLGKQGPVTVEKASKEAGTCLYDSAAGGTPRTRLLPTDQAATVSASIAVQGLGKAAPAACSHANAEIVAECVLASPRAAQRQAIISQADAEQALLVEEPSSEEDEVIDYEVAAHMASGRRGGTPACEPTGQEALVLAEVLQRDLALSDADPTALAQLVRRMQRVALSAGAELPPPLRCDEGRVIVLLTGTVHVHSGAAGAAASGESGAVDGEESEDQGLRDPQSSGVSSVSGSGINFGGGTAVEPPAPCASALAPDLAAGGSAPAAVGACAIVNAARDSEPVVCTGPCLLGKAAAEASAAPEGGVTGPAGAVAEPPVVCVVAATAAECWLLGASAMQQFCRKHSATARRLRFLRKVPALRGIPDAELLAATASAAEQHFADGQALPCGPGMDSLFVIRHGCVRGLLKDGSGASVLGRGHIIGARAFVDGKLQRARCEAAGPCQAVALPRAALDGLDAPQLTELLDVEAVDAVLQALPLLHGAAPAVLVAAAALFQRQSVTCGEVLALAGRPLERVIILRSGELAALPAGRDAITDVGGASVVGTQALEDEEPSSATVSVVSESAVLLVCARTALKGLIISA